MKYVCSVCGWGVRRGAGYGGRHRPGTPWSKVPEVCSAPCASAGKDSPSKGVSFLQEGKDRKL